MVHTTEAETRHHGFNAINTRAGRGTILHRDQLRNRALWLSLAAVLATQVTVVHLPWAQKIFGTVALTASQWAVCAGVALSVLLIEETVRLLGRRLGSPPRPGPAGRPDSSRRPGPGSQPEYVHP